MFKWVLNTPLNFDLFYLFLVNSWEWLPCSAPWENIFFLIFIAIQASSRFLVWRQISNWVKKQCEIWNSEEKCPTVEFRLWVRVRVSFRVGAIFLAGNLWKFVKHWWKWSQIYYSIINWLGHEQICLMRLIEHIRWWRVLINEHWKYRRKSKIYSDLRWC